VLDGVAEHGPGHGSITGPEKRPQRVGAATLSHLAEHPPHGLVDEIVPVLHEDIGQGKGVIGAASLDVVKGSDDRDPPLPEALRFREPVP
jgi:hypothetical protein